MKLSPVPKHLRFSEYNRTVYDVSTNRLSKERSEHNTGTVNACLFLNITFVPQHNFLDISPEL